MIEPVECVQCGQPARHVATVLYVMPNGPRGLCEMYYCDACALMQVPREDFQRLREARPDIAPDDDQAVPPTYNPN